MLQTWNESSHTIANAQPRGVTAETLSEVVLLETKVLQNAILNSANFAIIATDAKGIVQLFNIGAERLLGYAARDVVNKISPSDIHDAEEVIARAAGLSAEFATTIAPGFGALAFKASRGIEDKYELTYVRKDGSRFPAQISITALCNEQSEIIGYLLIGTDNSAAHVAAIERKRVELLKDEFVATVSHELRTPLTSIVATLGILNSIAAGKLPDPASRLLMIASSNSQRLVRLLNDILDIEKLASGKVIFDFKRIDVRPLIEQSIEENRAFSECHDVRVRLDSPSTAVDVRADPDRLVQVINNLLSNAIKFSPSGEEVVVAVEARNESVYISVRDHGVGISKTFRPHVFEKFAQANATDARLKGGSGLGLSIVKQIVTRLEGAVSFEGAPEGGTIFRVELPKWTQALSTQSHRLFRVLCIDDEPDVREVVTISLSLDPHLEVRVCASGKDGLAAAAEYRPDIILLDVMMPMMDGPTTLRHLRENPQTANIPVVFFTASTQTRDLQHFKSLGIANVVSKPFDPMTLAASVRSHMRLANA